MKNKQNLKNIMVYRCIWKGFLVSVSWKMIWNVNWKQTSFLDKLTTDAASLIYQQIARPFWGTFSAVLCFCWAVTYCPKGRGENESVCSQKRCSPNMNWSGKTKSWLNHKVVGFFRTTPSLRALISGGQHKSIREGGMSNAVIRNAKGFIPALTLAVLKGVNE